MSSSSENGTQSPSRSTLACYMCRKRKIKCGRELPHCTICKDTSQECIYPSKPMRPGPKIGSTHANSQKRQLETDGNEKNAQEQRNVRKEPPQRTPETMTMSETTPSSAQSMPSQSPSTASNVLSLSFIIHPTFENCSPDQTDDVHVTDDTDCHYVDTLMTSCNSLGLTLLQLNALLPRYFEVGTSFQLFRLTELQRKLRHIPSTTQRTSLLAAMLAFGLKGLDNKDINNRVQADIFPETAVAAPSIHFRALSIKYMDQAIAELEDERLSLPLLQAMILNTHCLLVQGVRGRAWRYLGTCIRAAYELNLHLVDAGKHSNVQPTNAEQWCIEEEWRRAWWAIWEMDVFASVIRRCPAGIDWNQNDTFLPAEDDKWYRGEPQPGCFLEVNVNSRWKSLAETQSRSPKAWFIVLNSLMKDAQNISSPTGIDRPFMSDSASVQVTENHITCLHQQQQLEKKTAASKRLGTVLNALHCAVMAVPKEFKYYGKHLSFGGTESPNPQDIAKRLADSYIYSIYLMTQLTKLMVLKYDVFRSGVNWTFNHTQSDAHKSTDGSTDRSGSSIDTSPIIEDSQHLGQYFDAADSVVNLIRGCSETHYQYLNPFLASTVWLAGAIQLLRRSRLTSDDPDRDLITSKFDLLCLTYQKTVDFWNMSKVPLRNWEALENGLDSIKDNPGGGDRFHYDTPRVFTAGNMGFLPQSSSQRAFHSETVLTTTNGEYNGLASPLRASPKVPSTYHQHGMQHQYPFLAPSSTNNLYTAPTPGLLEHSSHTQNHHHPTSINLANSSESGIRTDQVVPSFASATDNQAQTQHQTAQDSFSPAFMDTMPFAVDRYMNADFSNYLDEMLSCSYLP